jgi:hypothetical protein
MDQKWEHLFIRGVYRGNTLFPAYINGEPIMDAHLRSKSFYDYANELGEQGWELLTVDKENERFAFKRRKTAPSQRGRTGAVGLPRRAKRRR